MRSSAGRVSGTIAAVAFGALLAIAPSRAADDRVRFEIPEPFRVGTHTYSSGVITVSGEKTYSPTTSLLEVWVNGQCLGLVPARRSTSKAPSLRTEAMFSRDGDGRLVLVGYQVTGRPSGTTFRFQETGPATPTAPTASLELGSF
jgi:hypothetical protein